MGGLKLIHVGKRGHFTKILWRLFQCFKNAIVFVSSVSWKGFKITLWENMYFDNDSTLI